MNDEQNPYSSPQADSFHDQQPAPSGSFDAMNQRFMRLLGEHSGPTMILWVIICLINLPAQLLNIEAQQLMLTNIGLGFGLIGVIYLLSFFVGTVSYGSYRVMRVSDKTQGNVSLGDGIGMITERFVPVLLTLIVYAIAVVVGMLFCLIPGIIAALMFCVAPFIAACYGRGPIESMRMSWDWVKRHSTIIAILIGAGFAYGLVIGVFSVVIMLALGGGLAAASTVGYVPTIATWFITSIGGYFMWLYAGSGFVTMGLAEESMGTVFYSGDGPGNGGPGGGGPGGGGPAQPEVDAYGSEW